MIEVNLIPDVKQELVRAQIQRNVIISVSILVSIIAVAAALLVASYVYVAQGIAINSSNDTIQDEYAKLSSVEDIDKIITIKNQLETVSSLNNEKHVMSRLYDMLNVIVPDSSDEVKIASMVVASSSDNGEDIGPLEGSSARVTIEGQTVGGFTSLEVFEKMIASAVVEYKPVEEGDMPGSLSCGDDNYQCIYLTVGGGDRVTAVNVSEMTFGEDQDGRKTLYFKLSFTTSPEFLSNKIEDVRIKIGKDGNVTDSYLGVPRAIFESRPEEAVDGQD